MFLKRKAAQSLFGEEALERLARVLQEAEAVIVGAGAGLSTSAGFVYSGERFECHFSDFRDRYGFQDMYTGGFYPFPSPEEKWAYWSRHVWLNRYQDPPKPVYHQLFRLIQDKDYFVISTNVDHCFQKAGFDKTRLFYTQGDYGLFQCSLPCSQETWDNEGAIREMMARQKDMRIPADLIPRCPRCGRPAAMNLRADDTFVEDSGWHIAAERYAAFLRQHQHLSVLFLELGVGYNTPGIIKYPFWRMTYQNPKATYACFSFRHAEAPHEIAERSLCINGDVGAALDQLMGLLKRPDYK